MENQFKYDAEVGLIFEKEEKHKMIHSKWEW